MKDTFKSSGHISKSYDDQLGELNSHIAKMGQFVLDILDVARKALDTPGDAAVKKARKLDKELNALDFDLQEKATAIIALRQPMGLDLRFVVAALKITSSMERMGDLAKSSCKKTAKFGNKTPAAVLKNLKEMNALATRMVNNVNSAFKDLSVTKASEILDQDDEIDDVYHQLLIDIQAHVKKHPELIANFADIIFTAKNLERIGDHCTKIADLIHYIASGEHIGKVANQKKQLEDQSE